MTLYFQTHSHVNLLLRKGSAKLIKEFIAIILKPHACFAFLYLFPKAHCPLQITVLNLQSQWINLKQILVFIL